MSYLTKLQLSNFAREKAGARGLRGVVNEVRMYSKTTATTSIFLSHSHYDRAIIEESKIFFENLGVSIYVDWADETMPERTNRVTANKIKNQIISIDDKFVLLATNNALASKWCNWEVGIADPFKLPKNKMALLPIAENDGSWLGNEYLQLYPRIEKDILGNYYIYYPEGGSDTLTTWLRK